MKHAEERCELVLGTTMHEDSFAPRDTHSSMRCARALVQILSPATYSILRLSSRRMAALNVPLLSAQIHSAAALAST